MEAVDTAVMDAMAAAAADTLEVGTMTADSIVMTMTTTVVVVEATETQPAAPVTGRSATVRRGRANAWQARWANIALAGGAGRRYTCNSLRLGRPGDGAKVSCGGERSHRR